MVRLTHRVVLFAVAALLICAPAPADAAPASQVGTTLQLAFWNIRDLSTNSRDATELRQIAQVIHSNDFIGICELNDKYALKELCKLLSTFGGTWKSVQTSKKIGLSSGSKEHYGFLYRSDKLWPRTGVRTLGKIKLTDPGLPPNTQFDRRPAWCKFATLDGAFDFSFIVVHATFKDTDHTKAEVRALATAFTRVQATTTGDKDVLLAGDCNRVVGDDAFVPLLALPQMVDTTLAAPPTVIKGDNTYDHLFFQSHRLTEYTGQHGVTRYDEVMFPGDDAAASKACSDHRPIWIRVRVPAIDDD